MIGNRPVETAPRSRIEALQRERLRGHLGLDPEIVHRPAEDHPA
jgi:hypothetical protein